MRVSSFQIHRQATEQLQQLGAQAADSQRQIAQGKRLVVPGDDPVGASQLIGINQELGERAQFLRNGEAADVQLGLTDSVLSQMTDLVQRVQELTLQAGSGVQTQEDRQFIAVEIEARAKELIALANTTNASGQYLFSGFKGGTPPFVEQNGDVIFTGDDGRRQVQIDRGQFITTNTSGSETFVEIPTRFTNVVAQTQDSDSAAIRGLSVVDQDQVDALFPEKLIVEFNDPALAGGVANFTVRRASDQRPLEGLENVSYPNAAEIEINGIGLKIDGDPQQGDSFIIATSQQNSLFNTVTQFVEGLKEVDPTESPDAFAQLVERSIDGLNAASDQLLAARAEVGARFNTLSAVSDLHEDINLQLQEIRSNIEDLDFSEAVSNLAYESFVLEAAQQSFIRINQLSLFNRL